ncbi:MAG TPA: DegT/DnrJ/EryC1/StrS family aminotransferase [Candidatus Acidoferrales bacterium]|jgi:dTDP-4-amino-4,6-dideoxygalactose transaminase|nr:DegT/DnrJ/EryC1/StrS family aminotransferase [Candidatus Acidoferrales bacterium]
MKVPHIDLKAEYASLREEVLAALDRTASNAAFTLGEEVEQFEREFAALSEVKHCVGVNSGTSAVHLALLAVGVQAGDEVITSPNTFIGTGEAISYTGARPVFVDIDPSTANLDAQRIERAVTPCTKAILPVHLYGRPADMDAINEIARRRGLAVVEDACQAHGARYRGRSVGGLGDVGTFSFYPTKNLGAYGEGGAVVTNDDRIAKYARAARSHGQTARYIHDFVGYNYRMEGFQGAVLRVKLKHFAAAMARRHEIARAYRRLLAGARLGIPQDDPRDECAYHLFVVYVAQRDAVRTELEARGIETAIHYPRPLHLQKAYTGLGYPAGTFPQAEKACEHVLSLPFFPALTDEQVAFVAASLREIVGEQ